MGKIRNFYLLLTKYRDRHIYRLHHTLCCLSSAVQGLKLYCDICIWCVSKLSGETAVVGTVPVSEMTQWRTADKQLVCFPLPRVMHVAEMSTRIVFGSNKG